MPAGDGAASGSREARGRGALPLAVAAGWVGVGVAWGERWRVGGEVSVREVHSQAACLCGYGFIVVDSGWRDTERARALVRGYPSPFPKSVFPLTP